MKTSTLLSKNIALVFLFLCILVTTAAAQSTRKIEGKLNKGQKVKKLERQNAVENDGGKSLF